MKQGPVAIISDVHANLEALNAVIKEIQKLGIRDILFLGDAVGYGPEPDRCVEVISQYCKHAVAGNHDWAVIGRTPVEYFNHDARLAAEWTASVINKHTREFLLQLPLTIELNRQDLFLVHSTPRDPEAWNYILSLYDAEVNFNYFKQKVCLVGHSHRPFIIERLPSAEIIVHGERVTFRDTCRYIINAGSVGQPRDGDPRAVFVVIDSRGAEIKRIQYNYRKTQQLMERAGLPEFLIQRLQRGI